MKDDNGGDAREDQPQSFGIYLRNARLERGISLEQVCHHTRINHNQLLAIEQEAHDYLPAEVYVTGFLRMYAQAVGADAEQAVTLYRKELHARKMTTRAESNKAGRRVKYWLRAWAVIFLIGGAAAVAYVYRPELVEMFGSHHPDRSKVAKEIPDQLQTGGQSAGDARPLAKKAAPKESELPGSGSPKEAAHRGSANKHADLDKGRSQARKNQGASSQVSGQRYLLKVVAREDNWIKIIRDSQKPEEFQLKAGNHLELPAESGYNILIGNAGGMDLFLNGRPVPVFGKSGQIVTMQVP